MSSFFFGVLGGFLAWISTTLIGQPLYTFLTLRGEAAKLLALYEDEDPTKGPVRKAQSAKWIDERKHSYRECGAKLTGFAASNAAFSRWLNRWKYYPHAAGNYFTVLAELSHGVTERMTLKDSIIKSLKLGHYL